MRVHVLQCACGSQKRQLVGSLLPRRSWDGAQVTELGSLYSLSQLAVPDLLFCFYLSIFI